MSCVWRLLEEAIRIRKKYRGKWHSFRTNLILPLCIFPSWLAGWIGRLDRDMKFGWLERVKVTMEFNQGKGRRSGGTTFPVLLSICTLRNVSYFPLERNVFIFPRYLWERNSKFMSLCFCLQCRGRMNGIMFQKQINALLFSNFPFPLQIVAVHKLRNNQDISI